MFKPPRLTLSSLPTRIVQAIGPQGQHLLADPGILAGGESYYSLREGLDTVSEGGPHGDKPCTHYTKRVRPNYQIVPMHSWYYETDHSRGMWTWSDISNIAIWGNGLNSPNGYVCNGKPEPCSTFGSWDLPDKGLPILGDVDAGSVFVALPESNASLISQAIASMIPGIRPAENVSLINSIYELKDFAHLGKSLATVNNALKKLKGFTHIIPEIITGVSKPSLLLDAGKKTLRQLLKASADSYLQAEFNFLPLLSDIASVRQAILDSREQLRQLVKRANTPQKRHFKRILSTEYPDKYENLSCTGPTWLVEANGSFERIVRYPVREFNMYLSFDYQLGVGDADNSLGALADRLGVNLNPRIIWNAIKWSFVIDWLFSVNRWMDNWRRRNIEPVVNITGSSASVHIIRSIATIESTSTTVPVLVIEEEAYRRYPVRSLYQPLIESGLSPKEFSLASALAITRR